MNELRPKGKSASAGDSTPFSRLRGALQKSGSDMRLHIARGVGILRLIFDAGPALTSLATAVPAAFVVGDASAIARGAREREHECSTPGSPDVGTTTTKRSSNFAERASTFPAIPKCAELGPAGASSGGYSR
jgi:hypothetical protein